MSQHSKLMKWVASSWRQDVATRGCCAWTPVAVTRTLDMCDMTRWYVAHIILLLRPLVGDERWCASGEWKMAHMSRRYVRHNSLTCDMWDTTQSYVSHIWTSPVVRIYEGFALYSYGHVTPYVLLQGVAGCLVFCSVCDSSCLARMHTNHVWLLYEGFVCATYMWHMSTSHAAHMKDSCLIHMDTWLLMCCSYGHTSHVLHTYERIMCATHMSDSCRTYESHTSAIHVAHMNRSYVVAHMNRSYVSYERFMSHIWVAHMNRSYVCIWVAHMNRSYVCMRFMCATHMSDSDSYERFMCATHMCDIWVAYEGLVPICRTYESHMKD